MRDLMEKVAPKRLRYGMELKDRCPTSGKGAYSGKHLATIDGQTRVKLPRNCKGNSDNSGNAKRDLGGLLKSVAKLH